MPMSSQRRLQVLPRRLDGDDRARLVAAGRGSSPCSGRCRAPGTARPPMSIVLSSGSESPNSCLASSSLMTTTRSPAVASFDGEVAAGIDVAAAVDLLPVAREAARRCTPRSALVLVRRSSRCVSSRAAGRADASAAARSASTSASVSGGLRQPLARRRPCRRRPRSVIGKRETKNVVGPVLSRSLATLSLMPCMAAEITTTTNTPTAMPRIVRPARTLLARIESRAIVTPSPMPCSRCCMSDMRYSARSAAIGSSRDARLAGYTPAMMPTPAPMRDAERAPTRARPRPAAA